jgi:hypothetical protein
MKAGDLVIYKNKYSSLDGKIGIIVGVSNSDVRIPLGNGYSPMQEQRYNTFYDVLLGGDIFWISEKHLVPAEK